MSPKASATTPAAAQITMSATWKSCGDKNMSHAVATTRR
jgi:hypothetical protein